MISARARRIVRALEDAGVEIRGVDEGQDPIIWIWGRVEVLVYSDSRRKLLVEQGGYHCETLRSERVPDDQVVSCVKKLLKASRRQDQAVACAKELLQKVGLEMEEEVWNTEGEEWNMEAA